MKYLIVFGVLLLGLNVNVLFAAPSGIFQVFQSRTSPGRTMVYRYTPPISPRFETRVIVHGLGDDMTKLDAIAEQSQQEGYGVLQMDLHGHGRTLEQFMRQNSQLPDELDYSANVQDILALIQSLNIPSVSLIGHSYGGGIVYALGLQIEANTGIRLISVNMLAPYVQRVDKFISNYLLSPQMSLDMTAEAIMRVGVDRNSVGQILGPLNRTVGFMMAGILFARSATMRVMQVEPTQDFFMDPFVVRYMTYAYKKYFIHELLTTQNKTESEITPDEMKQIDTKVEAAIKVTKGIRSFDLMDTSRPLPTFNAPLLIIGGGKDKLVLPGQLEEFSKRLSKHRKPHQLVYMEKADHLFPRLFPEETLAKINEFRAGIEAGVSSNGQPQSCPEIFL